MRAASNQRNMVAHSGSLEERNKERNKESEEWKREKERRKRGGNERGRGGGERGGTHILGGGAWLFNIAPNHQWLTRHKR